MALSVLPGKSLAMYDHWFPYFVWASRMMRSSSAVHGVFRMSGLRWLCHLSRHCFPMRPGRLAAILDHFRGPFFCTCSQTTRSSSSVHCRFWPVPLLGVLGGDSAIAGPAQALLECAALQDVYIA